MSAEEVQVELGARSYNVAIGPGLIQGAGARLRALAARRVAVVTDDHVAAIHLPALAASLRGAGIECVEIVVPAGEGSKSFAQLQHVVDAALDARLERGDLILALGGGVVGDLAGFAAAIDYVTSAGLEAIERHEHALVEQTMAAFDEIPWIRVFGPPASRRAGIVSFEVEGIHPHDVAQILDWEGIAVRAGHHCTQPLMTRLGVAATTRASFYLYTLPEEIDRLVDGVQTVRRKFG